MSTIKNIALPRRRARLAALAAGAVLSLGLAGGAQAAIPASTSTQTVIPLKATVTDGQLHANLRFRVDCEHLDIEPRRDHYSHVKYVAGSDPRERGIREVKHRQDPIARGEGDAVHSYMAGRGVRSFDAYFEFADVRAPGTWAWPEMPDNLKVVLHVDRYGGSYVKIDRGSYGFHELSRGGNGGSELLEAIAFDHSAGVDW